MSRSGFAPTAAVRRSPARMRKVRPKTPPTKPFHRIHETIPKQTGRTSLTIRWRIDASEASHEPLNSLCGSFDPPQDRGCCARGWYRGGCLRYLGTHLFGIHPDRADPGHEG